MKIKSERDFWSGLMFLVVGVAFVIAAMNYPVGSATQPGPGYFRLLPSIALASLGVVVLFKALTFEHDGGDPIDHIAWRPLLAMVAAVALFASTVHLLGWFISVPLLVGVSSFASSDVRWKGLLASAIVLTLASWLIFIYGLKLSMPLWPRWLMG